MSSLSSRFSPNITSYDFLKIFALMTMFIDHTGWFFFRDDEWWRVVGRISFPVWIFLIGYARSRDIPKSFWIGGGLMVAFNFIMGEYILPLNILFTMLIARVSLDRITSKVFKSAARLYSFLFFCFVAAVPSMMLVEYGTLAYALALSGYVVRNKETMFKERFEYVFFLGVLFLAYWLVEWVVFSFSNAQGLVFGALLLMTFLILSHFQVREYPRLTEKLPHSLRFVVQFCGRYTLEIYVIHFLVLFSIHILMSKGLESVEWFSPRLFF